MTEISVRRWTPAVVAVALPVRCLRRSRTRAACWTPAPAGRPFAKRGEATFVLYYLPRPASDPSLALKKLPHAPFALVPTLEEGADGNVMSFEVRELGKDAFIPDQEARHYFGRGLTAAQSAAGQKSRSVAILRSISSSTIGISIASTDSPPSSASTCNAPSRYRGSRASSLPVRSAGGRISAASRPSAFSLIVSDHC